MEDIEYCLKYEYYREVLFAYHDTVINSYNVAVLTYGFDGIDDMNLKYCDTILFKVYPELLKRYYGMDEKYSDLITQIYLNDVNTEVIQSVEIISDNNFKPSIEEFKIDTNKFCCDVEEFSNSLMQLLEELSIKKMFITNSAILEKMENAFHGLHEEVEEVEEFLDELRLEFGGDGWSYAFIYVDRNVYSGR